MKKNMIAIICGVVVAVIIVTSSILSFAKMNESESIGADAALNIALNDAGINRNEATNTKSVFERENGTYIFDVEFYAGNTEYDYDIDASTGEILKREADTQSRQPASSTAADADTPERTTADAQEQSAAETGNTANTERLIGIENAKQIALRHAGLKENEVRFTKAESDREDCKDVYDVAFVKGTTEYEYEIDAKSGEILDFDREESRRTTAAPATTTKAASGDTYIGLETAKKIALRHAGFEAGDVRFTKAKLDREDGKAVYDVEFVKGTTEYEYEIDAKTGKILDFDREENRRPAVNTTTREKTTTKAATTRAATTAARTEQNNPYIGLEAAKKIALRHAGFSADEVRFTKAKIDYEDGRAVYEIEFVKRSAEYEYEIDAVSGRILEFEKES